MSVIDTLRVGGTDYPIDDALALDYNYVSDVTVSSVTYKTYWMVQPTSSNQVYGVAAHPTNGKLYRIYNNKGTYSVRSYDQDNNDVTGDKIKTNAAQTGSGSMVTNSVAAATTLDTVVGTLLSNDYAINDKVENIQSDSLEDTLEAVGWVGSNLLENHATSQTKDNVVFVVNNDGTITANGTAASPAVQYATIPITDDIVRNTFIGAVLTGCESGTSETYNYNVQYFSAPSTLATYDIVYGNTPYTIKNYPYIRILARVVAGAQVTNAKWSPMISRNGGAYVPYHPTVERCMFLRSEQAVLGAKNRFKDYYTTLTRNTPNDVSKTQTEDGFEIQCSTTNWSGYYWKKATITSYLDQYPQGIKLSFEFKSDISCACEVGTTTNKITTLPTTWTKWEEEYHSADECYNVSWYNKDTTKAPKISVRYPMIRLASDPDDTYAPYAETNYELTTGKCDNANIAPIEDGTTASQAYSTGQYLIHNGLLRKATTAIASGAEITNNNTGLATVGGELEQINSHIAAQQDFYNTVKIGTYNGRDVMRGRVTWSGTYTADTELMLTRSLGNITILRLNGIAVQSDGSRVEVNHYYGHSNPASWSCAWQGSNNALYYCGSVSISRIDIMLEYLAAT